MREFLKHEKRNIIISLTAAVIVSAVFTLGAAVKIYADNVQQGISQKVVRLHILANSNSYEDQQLKIVVRNKVLKMMSEKVKNAGSKAESIAILKDSMDDISLCAEKVLNEEGCSFDVNVSLEKTLFPAKSYGNIYLPSGYYDALRIEIGKAEGHNWWCVMYPSLCLYSENNVEICDDEMRNILTSEEYSVVAGGEKPNIKFMAVEAVKGIESRFN